MSTPAEVRREICERTSAVDSPSLADVVPMNSPVAVVAAVTLVLTVSVDCEMAAPAAVVASDTLVLMVSVDWDRAAPVAVYAVLTDSPVAVKDVLTDSPVLVNEVLTDSPVLVRNSLPFVPSSLSFLDAISMFSSILLLASGKRVWREVMAGSTRHVLSLMTLGVLVGGAGGGLVGVLGAGLGVSELGAGEEGGFDSS